MEKRRGWRECARDRREANPMRWSQQALVRKSADGNIAVERGLLQVLSCVLGLVHPLQAFRMPQLPNHRPRVVFFPARKAFRPSLACAKRNYARRPLTATPSGEDLRRSVDVVRWMRWFEGPGRLCFHWCRISLFSKHVASTSPPDMRSARAGSGKFRRRKRPRTRASECRRTRSNKARQ